MRHANCGGLIVEDWRDPYPYEQDDGKITRHPRLVCERCRKEVLGDAEIDLDGDPT